MNRLCFLALATAILLCGCALRPVDPGVITVNSYFAGATKGHLDCDRSQCAVAVIPSCAPSGACGGKVDYDPIDLKNQNLNVKITWTLDKGYGFCKSLGDGVFLKSETSNQFDPEPNTGNPKCTDSYFIIAHNSVSRPDKPYQYKILFHKIIDASANPPTVYPVQYIIDPSIVNK
jgi:hypothetical protein